MGSEEDRLETWNQIAAYLGVSVRTAQGWAAKKGLPVRRMKGDKTPVFAFRAELDAWVRSSEVGVAVSDEPVEDVEQPERVRPRWHFVAGWVGAGTVVVALIFTVILLLRDKPLPYRAEIIGNSLQAFDERGRALWEHKYPPHVELSAVEDGGRALVRIVDLFGNGGREIVAAVPPPGLEDHAVTTTAGVASVECLSADGKVLWSYQPTNEMRFGQNTFRPPWVTQALHVGLRGREPVILAGLTDRRWGMSLVVRLDPRTGTATLLFVNTGVIRTLDELHTVSGDFVLAAGFNNEYDGGALAVVREGAGPAISPQTPGSRHFCESCNGGVPDYYIVFPRSELNKADIAQAYEQSVVTMEAQQNSVSLGLREFKEFFLPRAFYTLSPAEGFAPTSLRFDSTYDIRHQELERAGVLNHSLNRCPERANPSPVRIWTARSGWVKKAPPAFGRLN